MAKRKVRQEVAGPLTDRHEGRIFARSAAVWRKLGAPECMWDDEVAVVCYDEWMPGEGKSLLRWSLRHTVAPTPDVDKMKADYLREVAAPRLLWVADALDTNERAVLVKWAQRPFERQPKVTKAAPSWLADSPPWRT